MSHMHVRMYNSIGVSAFVLKYRVPARPPIEGFPKWWAPLQAANPNPSRNPKPNLEDP